MVRNGELVFYYGAMGAAKTSNAIVMAHHYRNNELVAIAFRPIVDTRDTTEQICSHRGHNMSYPAIRFDKEYNFYIEQQKKEIDLIIIDEAQFLTKEQVEQLAALADEKCIKVFCYGLLTTAKGLLFEGSKRLVELADKMILLHSICKCGKDATMNAMYTRDGYRIYNKTDVVIDDGNVIYEQTCRNCWFNKEEI